MTLIFYHWVSIHSKKKSTSKHLFLVLQLVTNRGLYSVPGRTKWYLEAPGQAYWGPSAKIGARSEVLFFLECSDWKKNF